MNWHSTQNDTDSLLLVVYQGFLISAAASDTQLEYCQKGTLVGCGHVRNYVYTFLQVSSKLHMLLWQLLWSLVWWLVGSNFSYSTDKAAPGVHFGESGGRLYLEWHTVISGRVGWVSWSKWIEVGQLQRPAACSIVWPNPNPLHSYHVVFFCISWLWDSLDGGNQAYRPHERIAIVWYEGFQHQDACDTISLRCPTFSYGGFRHWQAGDSISSWCPSSSPAVSYTPLSSADAVANNPSTLFSEH